MNKEDVVYIYSVLLFSHKKRNVTFVTAWTDLEEIMLSEISNTKTNITSSHLYMESKKQSHK